MVMPHVTHKTPIASVDAESVDAETLALVASTPFVYIHVQQPLPLQHTSSTTPARRGSLLT
jgi:hypothetical protein